jgi:hypothetical protein
MSADAQISSAVIQAVTINMIDYQARSWLHNDAVHFDFTLSISPVDPPRGVFQAGAILKFSVPKVTGHEVKVFVVHE